MDSRAPDGRPASMLTDVRFAYEPDLTDLVGLDPDFTGGLDATEYVARQNCDCGETRQAAVEQMRRALLDGLEQIERHGNGGACVGAGDVEQLKARVTLEVGR